MERERTFHFDMDSVRLIYPREIQRKPKNLGVLEEYRDKSFTEKEINRAIVKLLMRTPYVSGAMSIKLSVHTSYGEYHHILTFKNYGYESQEVNKKSEEVIFKC